MDLCSNGAPVLHHELMEDHQRSDKRVVSQ